MENVVSLLSGEQIFLIYGRLIGSAQGTPELSTLSSFLNARTNTSNPAYC